MSNKVSVGILGCGSIAQFAHLEACRKASNVRLFAVCDADQYLANKMAAFYDAEKVFYNYDDMLGEEDLDLVIIATSDAFHLSACKKALLAGKHVLVEKPLGDNLPEAYEIKSLLEANQLKLQVGHMKRFDPGIKFARHFISESLGEMVAYKGWYCDSSHRYDMTDSTQPKPFVAKSPVKPKTDPKSNLPRYFMMAHGSHLIDTAHYLAGSIRSLMGHLVVKEGIYNWFLDIEFDSGSNGHLDLTIAIQEDWQEGFQIYGTDGSISGKIYNPWFFKSSQVRGFSKSTSLYTQPLDQKAHFFQQQLESFADCVLSGKTQGGSGINDGIATIKAMIAIEESIRSGQRVDLNKLEKDHL